MHCFRYFGQGIRKKAQEIQKFNDSPIYCLVEGMNLWKKIDGRENEDKTKAS